MLQIPHVETGRIKSLVLSRQEDWDEHRFDAAFSEYQKFLALCKKHPESKVMAPHDVDQIWHMHMLDSVNYTNDCNRIFGDYLHHDPCVGPINPDDTQRTLTLYEQEFGSTPPQDWLGMLTCANPCKGCGSISR